jgi:hypothetical protein
MHYSEIESNRFNFRIFRDEDTDIRPELLKAGLIKNDADILILRIPAQAQKQLHKLNETGLPYILADSLVEYNISTENLAPVTLANPIELVECRQEEEDKFRHMDAMIDRTFDSYPNHYFANQYLTETGSRAGYKEWVRDCHDEKGITWLLYVNGSPAGFFSGRFQDNDVFVAGPGAILPEFEGKLVYLDCIKTIPFLLREKGIKICKTATQSNNLVVQKQWLLAGLSLSNAIVTVHLNPLYHKATAGMTKTGLYPEQADLAPGSWVMEVLKEEGIFTTGQIQNFDQTWYQKPVKNETYTFRISEPIAQRNSSHCTVSVCLLAKENDLIAFFQIVLT